MIDKENKRSEADWEDKLAAALKGNYDEMVTFSAALYHVYLWVFWHAKKKKKYDKWLIMWL